MPSSFVDSYAPIVKLLIELNPRMIIDIGPGWGKYGLACREYLPDLEYLAGLDVPQGRLTTQDAIYDFMYVGDARETISSFYKGYNVALLIDVIEHMTLDDGHELLRTIRKAGCRPLVSTPKVFTEQHDKNNPFETHVSHWDWEMFVPHGIDADVSTIDSIIYLLSPG